MTRSRPRTPGEIWDIVYREPPADMRRVGTIIRRGLIILAVIILLLTSAILIAYLIAATNN